MSAQTSRKLIVAGICRNICKEFPKALKRLEELQALLPDTQFIIYENNSDDGTKEVLSTVSGREGWLVVSENVPDEVIRGACKGFSYDNKPCRMEVIAWARNKLLAEIGKVAEKEGLYHVLMIDLDIWDWNPAQVPEVLKIEGWDALCVNGMAYACNYRDALAFRSHRFPFGPEQLGEYWWKKTSVKIHRQVLRHGLVPVYSAFGGMTVYRWEAIEGLRYSGSIDEEYHKDVLARSNEPLGLATRFDLWKARRKLQREREVNGSDLFGDGSIYLNNSGYDHPVVCEHVPFHAAMRNRGAGRIFICTQWKARM